MGQSRQFSTCFCFVLFSSATPEKLVVSTFVLEDLDAYLAGQLDGYSAFLLTGYPAAISGL